MPLIQSIRLGGVALILLMCSSCSQLFSTGQSKISLGQARSTFHTKLVRHLSANSAVPAPPPNLFQLVRYQSAVGMLPAYLSNDPKDGQKHPAIIWIHGGWPYDLDESYWKKAPASNDQSGSAFWRAGIVTLYPALRGANEGLGQQESGYGEVDDVLAAAAFLAKQPFVDSSRIFLGGHSTGATLTLLTAEMGATPFRAIFCFGPANQLMTYDKERTTFDTADPRESELRQPMQWLNGIRTPVLIFEGTGEESNIADVRQMARLASNRFVHVHAVQGHDHFSILAPFTSLLAQRILQDAKQPSAVPFADFEP